METAGVVCAFCKGKGTDPYGIMSWQSTCYVCHGKGTVAVMGPHVPCRYCEGSGSHKTFSCPACRGAGVVPMIPGPTKRCPACEGRAYEISSGLPCLGCRGSGVVPIEDDENKE